MSHARRAFGVAAAGLLAAGFSAAPALADADEQAVEPVEAPVEPAEGSPQGTRITLEVDNPLDPSPDPILPDPPDPEPPAPDPTVPQRPPDASRHHDAPAPTAPPSP